ncbi:MAG: hypothetical protein WEB58_11215 [Planctomycetaceae bacterium]
MADWNLKCKVADAGSGNRTAMAPGAKMAFKSVTWGAIQPIDQSIINVKSPPSVRDFRAVRGSTGL